MQNSILPKYQQLAQWLRKEILTGNLVANDQLPTEEMLVRQYSCSRDTVRKALSELEKDGFIRREQGSGSYVNAPNPRAIPFHFSEPIQQEVSYRVLRQETAPASIDEATLLKVMPGTPVIHIEQTKLENGKPVSYSERKLPHDLCPQLTFIDLTRQSVHDILSGSAELPPMRALIEIEARHLDPTEAAFLETAPSTPAIVVNRLSYTAPNQPAVWYRGIFINRYALEIYLDPSNF
jgi:GntR family transcriptional regulator